MPLPFRFRRWFAVVVCLFVSAFPLRAQPTDTIGVYLTWLSDSSTAMVVNRVNFY